MRRDTQIGIILGIVILVIIGVFLSTRATDNEAIMPDLALSEGAMQKTEVKEIDINSFFKESKKTEQQEEPATEYSTAVSTVNVEPVETTQPEKTLEEVTLEETSNEDTSLEGKWEGVAEEIAEEFEIVEEVVEEDETDEEVQISQNTPSSDSEDSISEEDSNVPSYTDATEDVYYKVQSSDNLFKIAKKHYGDGHKWNRIFEANRDSMPDSNSLYVGQELLIPDITVEKGASEAVVAPVSGRREKRSSDIVTHTVQAGDTLYRIAEKYYDNPGVWTKILEANEDTIDDESSLIKGQVLVIPNL